MTHFDPTNATAGSLLLTQLTALWLTRLRRMPSYPGSDAPARRSRPLVRLHELEPEDFTFDPSAGGGGAGLDDDGLPHGEGVLNVKITEDNLESCVGSDCEYTISRWVGWVEGREGEEDTTYYPTVWGYPWGSWSSEPRPSQRMSPYVIGRVLARRTVRYANSCCLRRLQ